MKDLTLIAGCTYGGMFFVAIGCYALHWGVACVWLGICFFGLAFSVSASRDKEEKATSDDALDRKIRSRNKYAREQDELKALEVERRDAAKIKEKNP